jgi:hypothetical protein
MDGHYLSNDMPDDKKQSAALKGLKRFWILGAGRFGSLAVARIARRRPDAVMTVVDKHPPAIDAPNATLIRRDGIAWLASRFGPDAPVDLIVPAIPVHVLGEWLKVNLSKIFDIHPVDIPADQRNGLPNAMAGTAGTVYVSHADFICPDNCPEPKKICTHTGKPRPRDLFRLLAELDIGGAVPIVVRSHQLLPGVGGILPADLLAALATARSNCHRLLMVATACRCHGVVDFLRLQPKGRGAG